MSTIRQARVGEMIRRDLSEILRKEMRDPRLAMVSVTSVEVARDFTVAKVFVSAIGTREEKAAAIKALQGASGFLRGMLGRMLEIRTVPHLVFRYDTGIERGIRMFEVLEGERKEFAELPGTDAEPAETSSAASQDESL
ncbi:MAG: 30S ribosome-binding factor RbfA [Armatimonadota bacterium]